MVYTLSTNNGNGQPVPNAIITFSKNGAVFNVLPFPNNTGVLYIDSVADANLLATDVMVRVTAPGYNAAGTTGNAITGDWEFTLRPNGLNTAVIAGAAAGIGLLWLTARANNKKITGFDVKKDVLPFIVPAAVVIGGIVVYNMFFAKSPQDKARDAALDADIAAAGSPTLSQSEIAAIANALKEDLGYSWVSNDITDAMRQLGKPKNTADILAIIKAYGTHIITTFGIPRGTFTLEETVSSQMGASDIEFVNRYYAAQGINFNF